MREYWIAQALGLVVIPVIAGSCLRDTTGAAEGSWVRAKIHGAVETTYDGTGYFHVGTGPPNGASVQFTLSSDGVSGAVGQSFMLYRPGAGRPGVGRFTLSPLVHKDGALQGFTAYYIRITGDRVQAFTCISGELEITRSSGKSIEGTFGFSGALYYSAPLIGHSYDDVWDAGGPNNMDFSAPLVQITGSFVAIPLGAGKTVLER